MRAVAERHSKGNDIVFDARHAADKSIGADADPLMHGGQASNARVILDADMASQRGVVHEEHVIADLAIMGNMRADEKQTMSAHARDVAAALRPAIHGYMLSDCRMGPDDEAALLAAILPILRRAAKSGEGMDFAAF